MELYLIIEKLKESPLFYMFVSSRELFHSNFWYWLSKLDAHKTANIFGLTVNSNDKVIFVREYYHKTPPKIIKSPKTKIDLAIFVNGKLKSVIENKVKDFASSDQLTRIVSCFDFDKVQGKEEPSYCLVSLFPPSNDSSKWKEINYGDLAERMKQTEFTSNHYYNELITDYCQFASNLHILSTTLMPTDKYDFAITHTRAIYNLLNGLLWEGYQKMRGGHLISHYRNKYNDYKLNPTFHINNQKSTLHFPYELGNSYRIGIQIEDIQFRKFISCPEKEKADSFAKALLDQDLFFSKSPSTYCHKNVLNKYEPDFRYQYNKIEKGISQVELFQKINKELGFIQENFSQIQKLIT